MPVPLHVTKPFSGSLALAQSLSNQQAEADRLFQQGYKHRQQGEIQAAVEFYQKALAIYQAIGDRKQEISVFEHLGYVYHLNFGDIGKGKDCYQQMLIISQEIGDRELEGQSLWRLGMIEIMNNPSQNPAKAIKYFQQSLAIAQELKNYSAQVDVLSQLGLAYSTSSSLPSSYKKAVDYSKESVAIARKLKDRKLEVNALGWLAMVYKMGKDYAKALDCYQQRWEIAREFQNLQSEMSALNELINIYINRLYFTKAIEYLQQYLALTVKTNKPKDQSRTLMRLAEIYSYLGEYSTAIDYCQQSLAITRQLKPNSKSQLSNFWYASHNASTINFLASIYLHQDNYKEAIKHSHQALTFVQKIPKNEDNIVAKNQYYSHLYKIKFDAFNQLGSSYLNQGDYKTANNYYQQLLLAIQNPKITAKHKALKNKMDAMYYEPLRETYHALALQGLGNTYLAQGDNAKAIDYFQQALAKVPKLEQWSKAEIINALGVAFHKSGNFVEAEKKIFEAIEIGESLRIQLGEEDEDKIAIFQSQVYLYQNLQEILIDQGKAAAALEISERGRARVMLNLLASRLSSKPEPQIPVPNVKQIQQIAKEQNATLVQYSIIYDGGTESELFIWVIKPSGEAAFRRVEFKFLQQQDNFLLNPNSYIWSVARDLGQERAILWGNPRIVAILIFIGGSIIGFAIWYGRFHLTRKATSVSRNKHYNRSKNIQKRNSKALLHYQAKSDSLLKKPLFWFLVFLAVATSGGGLFLWMRQSSPIAQKPNAKTNLSLAKLVETTHKFIETKERGLGIVPLAQKKSQGYLFEQLHQTLIEPIADFLPTDPNARVIFIPQDSLFLVPFPALKDKDGKYLIEKHTILTAPSIQTLDLTRQQKERIAQEQKSGRVGDNFLVVGNPTMPSVPPFPGEPAQQLASLPGAEQEAKAIAKLFQTQAITGNQATKQAILEKMPSARIIHLATHGILDEIRGLGSAIALAPDPNNQDKIWETNGLLTAEEILDLQLSAELVVLSACDTGRGRITGDGVVGLSRSLISAGVPSVIVSLWSVPDAPTASLMTEFYRNLQQNSDKAQALRQAMLTTMKQHPNPRDWAAFTIIGEAN